jgi:hypothetical protein
MMRMGQARRWSGGHLERRMRATMTVCGISAAASITPGTRPVLAEATW